MALIQVNKLKINCSQYVQPLTDIFLLQRETYATNSAYSFLHYIVYLPVKGRLQKDEKLHVHEEPNVTRIWKTSFLEL